MGTPACDPRNEFARFPSNFAWLIFEMHLESQYDRTDEVVKPNRLDSVEVVALAGNRYH